MCIRDRSETRLKLSYWEQIKYAADKAANVTINRAQQIYAQRRRPRCTQEAIVDGGYRTYPSVRLRNLGRYTKDGEVQKTYGIEEKRREALRVASSYRRVPKPVVLVIAGAIPIDLLPPRAEAFVRTK